MGRGSYTASDWAALKNSKSLFQNNSVNNLFTSRSANSRYDCKGISVRESCDSPDSPESTPIIIGFDVTASMGYLAKELATNAVNKTVTALLSDKPIPDPQILCSAIGDSLCDTTPLQVTQFEADIRIIRQLTELYLEGGGGGNGGESYNLLWYFAANHTKTDCFLKRRKKGFLFTVGDDNCHPGLSVNEIKRVFGDKAEFNLSNEELLREAMKKYEVFHIHIDTGKSVDHGIFARWQNLLPGRSTEIHIKDIGCLSELITAIIAVSSGADANTTLRAMDQEYAQKISRSMAFIRPSDQQKECITF